MRQAVFAVVTAALLASACEKNNAPPPPTSGSPFAKPESGPAGGHAAGEAPGMKKAEAMFASVCATCHGIDGTGHGPAAPNLTPPPRNYTDKNWQSAITDDQIKKTILLGGAGVGKSPMMPAQPQLKDQPEVLDGLVQIIRGFAAK
jgi:mono/diheme cytochrome c family protein